MPEDAWMRPPAFFVDKDGRLWYPLFNLINTPFFAAG